MFRKAIGYGSLVGLIALLLATTIFAQNGNSDLILACVGEKGEIRIIASTDTCSRKESALSWNIQGPPGVPGPQGSSASLRVLDSEGTEVGILLDSGSVVIWNEELESWIGLRLTKDGFAQGGIQFAFTTPDCTGTAYVNGGHEGYSPLIESSFVFGDTIYQPSGESQMRTFHSAGFPDQSQPCEVNGNFTMISRPTIAYSLSDFGFIPPFALTK